MSATFSHRLFLATLLALLALSTLGNGAAASVDYGGLSLSQFGQLINFSVPCDLHSDIAIPDKGGLLTPNLLAVGYQRYMYDGSSWEFAGQHAALYNKSMAKVGRLYGGKNLRVTFEIFANQSKLGTSENKATITVSPVKSVYQMFSIPLQLLNITTASQTSNYIASHYVQRFATQNGLPPGSDFKAGKAQFFRSGFSALYAFYLPIDLSPQLATRVPRCGDERFYGLQQGRTPGF